MDPPAPTKKKRRRIHLNCEECRRTKSKCNRSWPCSECVKKGLAHICPNQVSKVTQPKSVTIAELTNKVKYLEQVLRSNGLEHEIKEGPIDPAEVKQETEDEDTPSTFSTGDAVDIAITTWSDTQGVEMVTALGQLTLGHSGGKRYAGMGTTAFYLSSPGGSESEGSDAETDTNAPNVLQPNTGAPRALGLSDRDADNELWRSPWGKTRGASLTGRGNLPGVLLDRCRAMLPSRRVAKQMFDVYFELTSWRMQPMTPEFFDTVLASIYDSSDGAHPHDLAVLFSTQAITLLFEPTSGKPGFLPVDYHTTAYSCLVAGNFYTETTLSSLVTLHLLGHFLLNAEDKRLPDGIFPIMGIAVRLAIIAGFHRDAPPDQLSLQQIDWRRRIWHELLALERVHCLTGSLPGSISVQQYDTAFPSDEHPDGYFCWKWRLGVIMARVFDFWSSVKPPNYQIVIDIDADIRRFLHQMPFHLRGPLPAEAFSLSRPGAPPVVSTKPANTTPNRESSPSDYLATISPDKLVMQQYRMTVHICMIFFYLHRPAFMRALLSGDHKCELSVQTVIEVCERLLGFVRGALKSNSSMPKWFSFAADLFSALLCQSLLVVKTQDPALAQTRMAILEEGLSVMEFAAKARPNSRNRALVQRTRRLTETARQSLVRFPSLAAVASGSKPAQPAPKMRGASSRQPHRDLGYNLPPGPRSLAQQPAYSLPAGLTPEFLASLGMPVPSSASASAQDQVHPHHPVSVTVPPARSSVESVSMSSPVAMHTPSGASSALPWPSAFELNEPAAVTGFTMPTIAPANDAQFDAWLAMLFPHHAPSDTDPLDPLGSGAGSVELDVYVNGVNAEGMGGSNLGVGSEGLLVRSDQGSDVGVGANVDFLDPSSWGQHH